AVSVFAMDLSLKTVLLTGMWRLAALLSGLLLAMPAILPAVEWAGLSPRAHGLQAWEVLTWSANWYDFVGMVLSNPLGDLNLLGSKFLSVAAARPGFIPYVASCYVGPVAATFAVWGLCDRNWSQRPYVVLVLAASITMALGTYTPVLPRLLHIFPDLAVFRFPEKLLFFVMFCVALLAGRGMHACVQGQVGKFGKLLACGAWTITL